ncbi:ubiquitin carboxyl-terminal hydrolase 37-like [Myripristis murdjan]|uniref:ubiquitin carboxyl-terminal hydrolase 37-like n=1 Tax=Myripristis murdjan TaxID=586833 RepID=UPI001176249B|nr:ubiquitin carboxyl-terminal hydrolase 37-like [Myripristis murdjan]
MSKKERANSPPWWRRWPFRRCKIAPVDEATGSSTEIKEQVQEGQRSTGRTAETPTPASASCSAKKESVAPVLPSQSLTKNHVVYLGLPNLAQTCYMNSSLQSLLTLRSFTQELSNQFRIWSSAPGAELIRGLVDVSVSRYTDADVQKRHVLKSFKRMVSAQVPEFADNSQKDAHEFLSCVLEQLRSLSPQLQEVAKRLGSSYTCPVQTHLTFRMQSTRTCKGCGEKSLKEENFTNLSLDLVPAESVEQSLQRYLVENQLEYRCECGADTSGQQWSFQTLPSVLILHLKRFRFTPAWTLEKVQDPVVLSRELLLTPGQSEEAVGLENTNKAVCQYKLISVLSHLGRTVDSGKMCSFCQHILNWSNVLLLPQLGKLRSLK